MHDRYGLEITTASSAARDAYVEGVDRLLSADTGAEATLEAAVAADPGFALAHSALARCRQLAGRLAEATQAAERGVALAPAATPRERRHAAITERVVAGDGAAALAAIHEHVAESPRDALALSPATSVFGLIGFSGRREREPEQLALLEPLSAHYGDDWWFSTALAFALIEVGRHAEGLERVAAALTRRPRNAHGAHVYVHGLYESGDDDDAVDYLAGWLPDYDAAAQLHCHLWWHLALLHLMRGEHAAAQQVYDTRCAPGVSLSPAINVVTDGASLLWRSELAGDTRAAGRWWAVRAYCEERFPEPGIFADVHYALCLAATEDAPARDRYLTTLRARARAGKLAAGPVVPAIATAAGAFAGGDWEGVIAALVPVLPEVVRIGGSRAQRDLVEHTLLAAYLKAGRGEDARRFLADRRDRSATVPVAGL